MDGVNAQRTTTSDANGGFRLGDLSVGGFTLRARYSGYDSEFRNITFVADTAIDLVMRPAMQTLAGAWTGTLAFTLSSGTRQSVAIPQLAMVHDGNRVSSNFLTSGPYLMSFSGTLGDPALLASTAAFAGTLTITMTLSGRGPLTCQGTSGFTGTVDWTHMVMTTPQVVFECGVTFTNVTTSLIRLE